MGSGDEKITFNTNMEGVRDVMSPTHSHVCRAIKDVPVLHEPLLWVMPGHLRKTLESRDIYDLPVIHKLIQWDISVAQTKPWNAALTTISRYCIIHPFLI